MKPLDYSPRRHEPPAMRSDASMALPHAKDTDIDVLAGHMAHELRTPLAQMETVAQLMLQMVDSGSEDDLRRWLLLQIEVTRQMRRVIDDMLDMARVSRPLHIETLDLSGLCNGLREGLWMHNPQAPVAWDIEDGVRVRGDKSQVTILIRNLLSNAAKFTRDTEHPTISMRLHHGERGVPYISIKDNGAGFDPARAAEMFEPFVRLHRSSEYDGVGLGLCIVKRIVERHGGWVRATRADGGGARFDFALGQHVGDPVAQALSRSGKEAERRSQ